MRLAFLLPIALLGACSGEDLPTAEELDGAWFNDDAGTTREFAFDPSAEPDAYVVFSYPTGTTPIEVQSGTYFIEDGILVTEVLTGTGAGTMFGNDILGWTGDTLTLESDSAASGERTYTKR
jgi:hypothetical protein